MNCTNSKPEVSMIEEVSKYIIEPNFLKKLGQPNPWSWNSFLCDQK